jgi:hypothetical protein
MRRLLAAVTVGALAFTLAVPGTAQAQPVVDPDDDKVTGQVFVRHDGGTDQAIEECNDPSTDPAPDPDPDDGDSDSNDGANRRQSNEPFSVIDPTDPDTIVAGWNDYCLTDFAAGWEGFAFSRDGGETWVNSLVPGYPQDTSAEGTQSPLFGNNLFAGDPIAAFDRDGNLFVGGISFNRVDAIEGHVFVASYGAEDQPNGYPADYQRTVIVGRGTPSRNFVGIFQDKPLLEVDRTGGQHDGNVYVCWSRFTGFGQNKIYFSRSTDSGVTFSRPIAISRAKGMHSVQGCDIAVEGDGDVYVTWRTFDDSGAKTSDGLAFARSDDGGESFSKAERIRSIVPYFPFDTFSRDCGDGVEACPSGFVFHRVPLEPRVTADQTGQLPGVYVAYNEIRPGSEEDSETSYTSAGSPGNGEVGQSLVYVVRTLDDGSSWSDPTAVDPVTEGHQYFPDIDALAGRIALIWEDSRTDPCYDVQLPFGNTDAATSCGTEIINALFSFSEDGESYGPSTIVSDVAHQPQYEMFSDRSVPFQGDYTWISLAALADGSLLAYMTWDDNRDVVPGVDPREADVDGFDVLQCREDLGGGSFGIDTCPNAGGLDQNIYGNSAVFAP